MLETAIDPLKLRHAVGGFATGVVVVTADTEDEGPVGMTMNSFSSVSLEPPLVLFCVSKSSCLHSPLTQATGFAVNVLSAASKDLSRRFAQPGLDRFGSLSFHRGRTGSPLLPGALAVIECATVSVTAAGDHDIVVGQVMALATDPDIPWDPLVFFAGAYRRLDHQYTDWWTAFT